MQEVKQAPAVTIRQPATANLMVDSFDRTSSQFGLANSFQIAKTQALLNGFFNRIGLTELTLEWFTPNISPVNGNNTLVIDLSGNTTGTVTDTLTIPTGFYTQELLLNFIADYLTTISAVLTPAPTWTVVASTLGSGALLTPSADVYAAFSGNLATILNLPPALLPGPYATNNPIPIGAADLRGIRYIDFISTQLTYNQDLKDASTAPIVRDVLARWYFAYDNYTAVDAFGFPILMGYEPFTLRRTFSPPKQIRWDNIQPVGNISFEVYRDGGALCPMTPNTNWLATLQVSEN